MRRDQSLLQWENGLEWNHSVKLKEACAYYGVATELSRIAEGWTGFNSYFTLTSFEGTPIPGDKWMRGSSCNVREVQSIHT